MEIRQLVVDEGHVLRAGQAPGGEGLPRDVHLGRGTPVEQRLEHAEAQPRKARGRGRRRAPERRPMAVKASAASATERVRMPEVSSDGLRGTMPSSDQRP